MPICHAHYRFTAHDGNLRATGTGVLDALAEEERLPNDWGEPGELVWRRWLRATDRQGHDYAPRLNGGGFGSYGTLEPIGPLAWHCNPNVMADDLDR